MSQMLQEIIINQNISSLWVIVKQWFMASLRSHCPNNSVLTITMIIFSAANIKNYQNNATNLNIVTLFF